MAHDSLTEGGDANPPPESSGVESSPAAGDSTLGGYLETHNRPPAFEGIDQHPYTVSIEVDKTPNLHAPFLGYLVFPRWAQTGLGIVGHVESPVMWEGRTRQAVVDAAGLTSLLRVKELLDDAIITIDEDGSV